MKIVRRKIITKPEVCMGCRLCEIWCAVAHSKSKDIIKAFLYEENKPQPRIAIEEKPPDCFILICHHCEDPECVEVCTSGALYKDENGIVLYDESKCVACYSCITACPYDGAIRVDKLTGKILKCDLCKDLDYPYCVANCPNNALELVIEIEEYV